MPIAARARSSTGAKVEINPAPPSSLARCSSGPLTQCPHNNLALNSFMAAAVLFMVLREHINSAVRRPRVWSFLSATIFSSTSLSFNPSPILSSLGRETCRDLRMSVGKSGEDELPPWHAASRRLSSWRSDRQMDFSFFFN